MNNPGWTIPSDTLLRSLAVPDSSYDAILVVGFGGPEKPADVLPFLENVVRGRNVPRERLLEVAAHYDHFGGKSPINDQMRELIARLGPELAAAGLPLPVFWGNRNWHPLLTDTLREMTAAGIRRALAYVSSAYSSYSSCRQYLEDIARARAEAGAGAPAVDKLRPFYNHPLFIAACVQRLLAAVEQVPAERRAGLVVAFTAHSIPLAMARGCRYEQQLRETCRLVAERAGIAPSRWQLVYQSRSGRPDDPWLEPDIGEHLHEIASRGVGDVVVMPIGFLSDHLEVLYDLDHEARQIAEAQGLDLVRAATVGAHPLFVRMIAGLIAERALGGGERLAAGAFPAWPDTCPADCCPPRATTSDALERR